MGSQSSQPIYNTKSYLTWRTSQIPNIVFRQNSVSSMWMLVGVMAFHDLCNVLTGMLFQDITSTWMPADKIGHIINFARTDYTCSSIINQASNCRFTDMLHFVGFSGISQTCLDDEESRSASLRKQKRATCLVWFGLMLKAVSGQLGT